MSKTLNFKQMKNIINPFLYEVAEIFINRYGTNQKGICFVFPNKRSGDFFRKYYSEIHNKSTWSPSIYTINSLAKKLTNLKIPHKLNLIFDLHAVIKTIKGFGEYDFDKFYSLGELILSDLNEIDSYLVDVEKVFSDIKDIYEIDGKYQFLTEEQKEILKSYWSNFIKEKQSNEINKYLKIWKIFPTVYKRYREKLLNKNFAYEGLIYRVLSEKIEAKQINHHNFNKFVFIGFNALNKAQEKLFEYFKQSNIAEFYWNVDNYYLNDKKQEAGFFMRKNIINFPQKQKFFQSNFEKEKNIDLIGVPLEVGQAKSITTILENLANTHSYKNIEKNTAIILADEHLLYPVLHSIPKDINLINVTMGYPLSDTQLYILLNLYVGLQESIQIQKNSNKNYYYKTVISILQHSYIQTNIKDVSQSVIAVLESENQAYINYKKLLVHENTILELLFSPISDNNGIELLGQILNILFYLFSNKQEENSIDDEYIYQAYIKIKGLKEIFEQKKESFGIKITSKILKQLLKETRIPFTSEKVEGIQIMGIMESRNIDFENVIILGLNEGVFPSQASRPSLLTENLRHVFDLPLIKHQDSIFSYLFYSVLQRAENVFFLYNNITGYNNSREISRFVQQIIYESKLKINHLQLKQNLFPEINNKIIVYKNEEILNKLKRYFSKGQFAEKRMSVSAINTYIDCKLKFYFRYIAEIYEEKKIEEEISSVSFGSILHLVIESIYKDFVKTNNSKTILSENFDAFYDKIDKHIDLSFKKHYNIPFDDIYEYRGSQIIIREVIKSHTINILNIDKKYAPFELTSIESRFNNTSVKINIDDEKHDFALIAVIDRIDKKNGIYRIIDYKTGSVDKNFSDVPSLFVRGFKKTKPIMQLFFYSLVILDNFKYLHEKIIPGIYDVRSMKKDSFDANIYLKDRKSKTKLDQNLFSQLLIEYKNELTNIIETLFDKDIPYEQTSNEQICKYCSYNTICKK